MSHGSYMNVFAVPHHSGEAGRVAAGDFVRTSDNYYPHFAVIAIHGDKAWLRNVETGQDTLAPLERCRPLEADIAAIAAE
jgi:hypothetical protein